MNTAPQPDSLEALYADLARHDWFYEMSDDHRVWSSGKYTERLLRDRAMRLGPAAMKLAADYSAHVFSGEAFGKERKPEPKLEDYTRIALPNEGTSIK